VVCNNFSGMTRVGTINNKSRTALYQCDRCKTIRVVKEDLVNEDGLPLTI